LLDLMPAGPAQMRARVRGADIAMIFQEPMTSLNPVFTVGEQIAESVRTRARTAARAEALRMLELVRIPEARNVLGRYPHQLGRHAPARDDRHGLSCKPQLLIADEPTTALDVTIQAQILR
jgi:glutathione transport system ATP-binding protein